MRKDPVTIAPEARLRDALGVMTYYGVRQLPVVNTDRKYRGIVRDRAIRLALEESRRDLRDRTVDDLTELGSPTLAGDDSTDKAWTMLGDRPGCSPLPVVEGGELLGVVSLYELLRSVAGLQSPDEALLRETSRVLDDWAYRSAPLTPYRPLE